MRQDALLLHVTVPTYRRPLLLNRALMSLIAQTDPDWLAVVFDNSPDREGQTIVEGIGDDRICYIANSSRLGAAANIDRCFGRERSSGSGLGLLLEDDNFLLPGFIELVKSEMTKTEAWLGFFNQRVFSMETGIASAAYTTRGDWFSAGWVTPFDLHASLLLMEGLSNGGIVWRRENGARTRSRSFG